MLSFRLRVLTVIIVVALTASGTTAWLTVEQTTRQVRQTQAAGQAETSRITTGLRAYGLEHGSWAGVGPMVAQLARQTGQRIRLVSDGQRLLADSDLLAGRAARQTVGEPTLIDPRPQLTVPPDAGGSALLAGASQAYNSYRRALPFQACLTSKGAYVPWQLDRDGLPKPAGIGRVPACDRLLRSRSGDDNAFISGSKLCLTGVEPATACVKGLFLQSVTGFSAGLVQVYLGAVDEQALPLDVRPVAGLAAGVAVLVMLAAILISRTALKPMRTLTAASYRLGAGDLEQRVPVSGRDEIAQLGVTFNWMAASLQEGEARQRQLINDVAHELRSPLANLLGYLEALKDGVLPPSPQLLESLYDEAVLQRRIVDDLQDLALAEAGSLTYHFAEIDVADLLAGTVTAQAPAARRARVELIVDAASELIVRADPDRMRQILGNLVNNALRATPEGGSVRLSARRGDAGVMLIEVTDTGHGIPAEQLPHVFDRFWRADPARGRATGGSGLGLAIVRRIVLDHHGTIDVASIPHQKTTFTIQLPE